MSEEELDQPQTLIAHLTELRDRIIRCLIAVFYHIPVSLSFCE